MRRIILDFISSFVLSIIGFLAFAGIYKLLELLRFNINFGGDKGAVLFGLFFGLPLGSLLGVLINERFIYKAQDWNFIGMILAGFLSFIISYFSIIILEKYGGGCVILIPLLVAAMCVFAYNIVLLFAS